MKSQCVCDRKEKKPKIDYIFTHIRRRIYFISSESVLEKNLISIIMKYHFDRQIWTNQSQAITDNSVRTSRFNTRHSRTVERFDPVPSQRINVNSRVYPVYHGEYLVPDKEKEARVGRWVLNVIATRENHQKSKTNKCHIRYTNAQQLFYVRI